MKKKIHHHWMKQPGWRTWKCSLCGAIKKFDKSFGGYYVYWDMYGGLHAYRTPECVLPNTKLK